VLVLPFDNLKENGSKAWPRHMETIPPTRPKARSLTIVTALRHDVPPPPSIDSHGQTRAPGFRARPAEHHQRTWDYTTDTAAQQKDCARSAAVEGTKREVPDWVVTETLAGGSLDSRARRARCPETTLGEPRLQGGHAAMDRRSNGSHRRHWRPTTKPNGGNGT
jgi:hypothetical protein